MYSKRHYGKQVFNKFVCRDSFMTQEAFEAEVKHLSSEIEKSWWIYTNSNSGKGIVKIHRNKHGARIIAYDYKHP